ncbi:MAG: TIGR03084 family protein [Streptosporangiales bacterium]|nr:TIGR03084 family protein [Streptosporangiales bacterium]
MATVDDVLADLTTQGDDLDQVLSGLSPEQWRLPTPAAGWTIAHQVAHLTASDRHAALAAADAEAFHARRAEAGADFDAAVDAGMAPFLAQPPDRLLAEWRAGRAEVRDALAAVPPGQKVPWIVVPMAPATLASTRLMEMFAHGQDIADAVGVQPTPTDRIVHVAHLGVRTRDFAYQARGLTPPAEEFRVELTSPSGRLWTWGPADAQQKVTGPALDFCLLVTKRRHRDDLALVADGPDADGWLTIAQAYAGPPTQGRAPGQSASRP